MRVFAKRLLSLLLVLGLLLPLLPFHGNATEGYLATAATDIPLDKDVAIYNAHGGCVFTSVFYGGRMGTTPATLTENTLEVPEGAGAYRFIKNSDDTYYITYGGKYLYAVNISTLELSDTAVTGAKWNISASGEDYTIANAEVTNGSKAVYLEYYANSFTLWPYQETKPQLYAVCFFELPAGADEDGDGRVGADALPAGNLPADGSKVVIYNHSGSACIGAVDGTRLASVKSKVEGDSIAPGNEALIFTVHAEGEYYSFENQGKFLRVSENNSDGTNAEELFFDEVQGDYSQWLLEEVESGYLMINKTAAYKQQSIAIEYFDNTFMCWTPGTMETSAFAMKFYEVEDELNLGYVIAPKMAIDAQTVHYGVPYTFAVQLDDPSEVKSLTVTASIDDGVEFPVTQKSVEGKNYVYTIDGSKLTGSKLTIKGTAVNEYQMSYSQELSLEIVHEPLILSVSPKEDEEVGTNRRPEIVVEIANCGEKPQVILKLDDRELTPTVTDSVISYTPVQDMMNGRHRVSVSITREDGKTVEKQWSFVVGDDAPKLYFGQLHSHTAEYSDGTGTLEDAYAHASQAEDIDFMFVTDHSNYFDTTKSATASSYYDLSSLNKTNSGITQWEEARDTAKQYTTDTFIAGYGYEMTWSAGPGHINTFNTYGTVSRNNATLNNKTDNAGMYLYNDLMVNANLGLDVNGDPVAEGVRTKYIEDAPVVSQFNHPGSTYGNFDDFAGYDAVRDTVLNLLEVGNGEGMVGGSNYWPSYDQYDLALSRGWHVAPTNNQDNHGGGWGDANTARTVIITEEFSEAGLYRAMSKRQVYATEDQNLHIYYYLNDALMGSILEINEEQPLEKVNIRASVYDPDGEKLGKIEVIGENGRVRYAVEAPSSTYELQVELENTENYYYLRITQADGDIAVTAPVWVGEVVSVEASLTTDALIGIVGEQETLSLTVRSCAAEPFEIQKIELYLGKEGERQLLSGKEINEVLTIGKKAEYQLSFQPKAEGMQIITAVVHGTCAGKTVKKEASLQLKAYDGSRLVRVGVDYAHDNYYTTGDYRGNTENIVHLGIEHDVLCEKILTGGFTYENIKQYKLLILTVPYLRREGKANTYTEEELAALSRFTAEGGSIIVCSKSDRDNLYDNCAENSNAILEAVGAHSRVVNGIVVDNERKALEAYRLYLSSIDNFNTEHPFTRGAYTASDAFGTKPYSGNQTGFQMFNGAPIEIQEGYEDKVEILVRGYDTTWGSHYNGYFTGSSFVPEYDESDASKVSVKMGDVNLMTYEKLPAGGWVLTSGVTFFSDYDIRDGFNHANKYIMENIFRSLQGKEETVTPIAEVKKHTEGRFTVDGYVTSNSSAYDKDTAFYDCIYIQDKEGNGINIFPVAGKYAIGMNVRCCGSISEYCGEAVLNLEDAYYDSIRILSDELYDAKPEYVSCADAMADGTIGKLMELTGKVVDIHKTAGVIDRIYVQDATGTACVFIDTYINEGYTGLDGLETGMMVRAVGIGSRDLDVPSASETIYARLRVRRRSEIETISCSHEQRKEVIYQPATCAEEGLLYEVCLECKCHVSSRKIPVTEHEYEFLTVTPTCTTDGYVISTCKACGFSSTQQGESATGHSFRYLPGNEQHYVYCNCGEGYWEDHAYTGEVCICGQDRSIRLLHTLNLASDISISYVVKEEMLQDYDSFYLKCVVPCYDGNRLTGTRILNIQPEKRDNHYYFTLEGLTAVNMNDMIEATLHMEKDGQSYFSTKESYSIATYAYAQLGKAAAGQELKVLCANLLRYGAAAQVFKGYRTDVPADADLTAEQRTYLTDLNGVTFGNNSMIFEDIPQPIVSWVGKSLDLQSKVGIRFVVDLSMYPGNWENVTLRVNYKNLYGQTVRVTLSDPKPYDESKGYYAFTFDGLMAAELRSSVSAAVFAGQTQLSQILVYSPDTYGNGKTGNLLTLCQALFAYSDAAKAYFVP